MRLCLVVSRLVSRRVEPSLMSKYQLSFDANDFDTLFSGFVVLWYRQSPLILHIPLYHATAGTSISYLAHLHNTMVSYYFVYSMQWTVYHEPSITKARPGKIDCAKASQIWIMITPIERLAPMWRALWRLRFDVAISLLVTSRTLSVD